MKLINRQKTNNSQNNILTKVEGQHFLTPKSQMQQGAICKESKTTRKAPAAKPFWFNTTFTRTANGGITTGDSTAINQDQQNLTHKLDLVNCRVRIKRT
jgi:hypothetical protein